MMRPTFIVVLMMLLAPTNVQAQDAEDFAINIAERQVDITTGFTGSNFVVFGTRPAETDIALVVRGPAERMVVRKSKQLMGLWIGQSSLEFRRVPLYYDYALSRPQRSIAPKAVLAEYGIGLDAMQFEADDPPSKGEALEFEDALIRNKQARRQFPLEPKGIEFTGAHLFKANFYMPTTVPTGDYRVQAFLLKQGQVIRSREVSFRVAQAGMSADIVRFAKYESFLYALVCLFIAISAGGAAHILSRRG